jgi:membrane protease YdiL (CAAX protease family)
LPLAAIESANDPSLRKMSAANPVVQLLAMKNWATLLLGGASVIIIAPVAEEFFFRVLLQGWLEKVERAWRRRLPTFRRWMPSAAGPVLISSFVFASQHFRKQAPVVDLDVFTLLLACDGIIKIISIIFTVLFLRWRVGATAADLGWAPENILPDLRLGLVTFAAILVPIYGSVIVASQLLSKEFAPDPISIFFFAIALGLLYNRTHRAAPSIALHMALNATSLAMFYLGSAG